MKLTSNRIKFQQRTYNKATMKKNLRQFVSHSTNFVSSSFWYFDENNWIEQNSKGLEMFKACGIFAALSPQMSVPRNRDLFKFYLLHGTANHYKTLVKKCNDIMKAKNEKEAIQILNGKKITSFYLNLLHPNKETKVTIDRHAVSCLTQKPNKVYAINDKPLQMTNNQYNFFENVYKEVSYELNVLPHELQAIAWVSYRQLRNLN